MKIIKLSLSLIVIIPVAIYGFNYFNLQKPLSDYMGSDNRNSGIKVTVHFQNYIDTSKVVFDIDSIQNSSKMDVFRVLLNFSALKKQSDYSEIILSYKGKPKFIVPGEYFKQLGIEFGTQNPIYTIRTFPEHIENLDGSNPYEKWTGGLLGVLQKQMEDFNDFHRRWYDSDMPNIEPGKNLVLDGL